jgi:hypothetical protein
VEGGAVGIVAGIGELTISGGGCSQELDHIAWNDVVFENIIVIYHGGSTILNHVQFKNCEFSVDYTPAGQKLVQSLMASNTVTITVP